MNSPDDGDEQVGDRDDLHDAAPEPADGSDHPREDPTGEPVPNGDGEAPTPEQWRSETTQEGPAPDDADAREDASEAQLFVYDLVSSVLAVALVGAYLFTISGVWPPLVAVESESMVPNMQVNDLVFVMEEERFAPEDQHEATGVVTARAAEDYRKFGGRGDVIVFAPDGNEQRTPIIHRAMFHVEEGENWYARADKDYVGSAASCNGSDGGQGLRHCPAPHDGFITKGDNNAIYDQAGPGGADTGPVKAEWVVGTAEVRVPGLGWVRLTTQ